MWTRRIISLARSRPCGGKEAWRIAAMATMAPPAMEISRLARHPTLTEHLVDAVLPDARVLSQLAIQCGDWIRRGD
jgi:hypothetical protein